MISLTLKDDALLFNSPLGLDFISALQHILQCNLSFQQTWERRVAIKAGTLLDSSNQESVKFQIKHFLTIFTFPLHHTGMSSCVN